MTDKTITRRSAKFRAATRRDEMSTNPRRNLIRRAANLVIVNDGAYRWVGVRREIYRWLANHGISVSRGSAEMDAEQYQQLCDETECLADTTGCTGPKWSDPHKLIEKLGDRGADYLRIQ